MRSHAKAAFVESISAIGRAPCRALAASTFALLLALVLGAGAAVAAPPTVTIDPSPTASYTTAQVSGTVDPADNETIVYAEYATDPAGPYAFIQIATLPAGAGPTVVSGEIAGLQPATQYYVRLDAYAGGVEYLSAEPNPSLTTLAVAAPVVSIEPVTTFTGTTAHLEGEIDTGGTAPAFDTTWRFQCLPECPGLATGVIVADGSTHTVEADASGLLPGTDYEVLLVAENAGGQTLGGPEAFTTSTEAPVAITLAAVQVTATSAVLRGRINPNNQSTHYYFEYGAGQEYSSSVPAAQDGTAGQGNGFITVLQTVSGLQAGASHHYRVVAVNSTGTRLGEDQSFDTAELSPSCPNGEIRAEQRATFLADCRAYEQVSPPGKNGGDVMADSARTRAAVGGDAVGFASLSGFGDIQGTGVAADYVSVRDAAGWITHGITPQVEPQTSAGSFSTQESVYVGKFSSDLSTGVVRTPFPMLGDAGAPSIPNLYLRRGLLGSGTASYQLLTKPSAPVGPQGSGYKPYFVDASDDFSHIVIESELNLTPDATGSGPKVYEWDSGTLRLAGILPAAEGGGAAQSSNAAKGTAAGVVRTTDNAISDDGRRIFFTAPASAVGFGQQYMRLDGSETLKINASEKAVPDPVSAPATFWTATPSGSRAFFTSREQLTDDDDNAAGDLYMNTTDAPTGSRLTRISIDGEPADGDGSEDVLGVLGAGDDGSYVYFVSRGQLGIRRTNSFRPRIATSLRLARRQFELHRQAQHLR